TSPVVSTGAQPTDQSGRPTELSNIKVNIFFLGYQSFDSIGSYNGNPDRYQDVTDSLITKGILDTGSVSVFFDPNPTRTGQNPEWTPLPYQFPDIEVGRFWHNIDFKISMYKVRLYYFFTPYIKNDPIPYITSVGPPGYFVKIVVQSGPPG
ncbi:MAG: hypothetical protein C5B59_15865, partial [Bacteroidetes bacterium]